MVIIKTGWQLNILYALHRLMYTGLTWRSSLIDKWSESLISYCLRSHTGHTQISSSLNLCKIMIWHLNF
uniref:Uncharacterized protein n=1 Tax=Rhizophora mucronata TaxID=61149 RepID=A0A2P2PI70_RHIMU